MFGFKKKQQYDFVGIGDTVTDAFIKLKDATVEPTGEGRTKICMNFGDKVPYEEVNIVAAVGNSANATVSATRLGLKTALITNLGDDYYGKECLDVLKSENINTDFVKLHKGRKTNYHYVLVYGAERTILIKHEDYPYEMPDIGSPKWLYLSSLGEKSLAFHSVLEQYLNSHPDVNLIFQPGTYQMKFGKEALAGIYKRTKIFVCNKEEAQRILGSKENDVKNLMQMLHQLGPKIVCVTDGPNGSSASDGTNAWFLPMYPDPRPPINRTGAGDAFTSTFAVAIILGKPVEEALMWGPINSMSVVQRVGARAGLLSKKELLEYLVKAPADYKPKAI